MLQNKKDSKMHSSGLRKSFEKRLEGEEASPPSHGCIMDFLDCTKLSRVALPLSEANGVCLRLRKPLKCNC